MERVNLISIDCKQTNEKDKFSLDRFEGEHVEEFTEGRPYQFCILSDTLGSFMSISMNREELLDFKKQLNDLEI